MTIPTHARDSRTGWQLRSGVMPALLLSAALASMGRASTPARDPASDRRSASAQPASPPPAWVDDMWEHLVGTWVADNRAFKDGRDTMDAYGIEWSWGLGRKSLIGRLYGIRDGREVGTFWQFREFWHPGERTMVTAQFGSDGTYGVGPHDRKPDGSTEMLQTFYDPSEGTARRVGHRAVLEGDTHTTTSFDVGPDGVWTKRRTYVWRRQ